MKNKLFNRTISMVLSLAMLLTLAGGCAKSGKKVKLDPKNPVTVSVWHYYNGAIMNAFEDILTEFNETVGMERGIILEGYGFGNVGELEKAVMSSAKKEIGSMTMPNIFASYADTAHAAERLGLLANLGEYFVAGEQAEYLDSYIEEGRIGLNGELRIFPVAKSTEILMVNETDWLPFAQAAGVSYADLETVEGLTRVAKLYYDWTDSLTPTMPDDGKSFFGRDSMANFFIIASKEFDVEIFQVENGEVTVNVDTGVMRKLWDNYYVPYISGYFSAYGRFRSDDAKVGDILAYVGSTSSAAYFPSEVTAGGNVYPVTAKALPAPYFEGAGGVIVQQGAGMVVTKGTPQQEYASVVFLKWFTEARKNIEFSMLSGYMPVKKEAVNYDTIMAQVDENSIALDAITEETLKIALEQIQTSELYTNKAFDGGATARAILDYSMQDKAVADREAVLLKIEAGCSHENAVAGFNTDENFNGWLADFTRQLDEAVQ